MSAMAEQTITCHSLAVYEQDIDRWIIGAWRAGAQDFWDLVSQLPAVYPTVVRQALDRLVEASRVPDYLRVQRVTWNSNNASSAEVPGLPIPNPLAFDWRYTWDTAAELLDRLVASTDPTEPVGLLGSPSVYRMAAIRGVPRQFILLDQSGSLSIADPQPFAGSIFRRGHMQEDADDLPPVQAVLTDPPWYEVETLAFLRTAARMCSDQGKVLLSWAPYGVRPGIQEERQRIIKGAKEWGLRFLRTERHVLTYATPFFEHNALRAAAFAQVMPNWRRGDLLIFERTAGSFPGPRNPHMQSVEWAQADVLGTTIWVRPKNQESFCDPSLEPLVPGDILPTVSRRDDRREAADVWTAGNRIYRCDGSPILSVILNAMGVSEAPHDAVERRLQRPLNHLEAAKVETAIIQIEGIIQTELQEMRNFVNGQE